MDRFSPRQLAIYNLIKSHYETGMSYKWIAKYLNDLNIRTNKGHRWGTNNTHMVVKRYREREARIKLRDKEYPMVWSKMRWEYDEYI